MAKGSSQTSTPPPLASRRNFRLSPLEIMVGVLIGVAVLYLITVWFSGGSSREAENTTPAITPGSMMERAVASSEKVLAEQVEISRDLGSLRKQVEAIQAHRGGGGTSGAADASQDRRLDEIEKSVALLAKRPGGQAPDLRPLQERLDHLEKALKERPAPAGDPQLAARLDKLEKRLHEPASAPVAPAAPDAKLIARVETLEKALKEHPVPAGDPQLAARLDKLEKRLHELPAAPVAPAAPDAKLAARLEAVEKALSQRSAPTADPQLAARLDKLEKRLHELPAAPVAPAAPDAKLAARLEAVEKALSQRSAPTADPQLAARLDKLEKRLAEQASASLAPGAPAADPGLEARLNALEAESARQQAALQRQVKDLTAEVERQEKGVAADRRLAALERRLSQMERHPTAEPRREARAEVKEEPRPAPRQEAKAEAKPAVKSAPRHEPEAKRINHKVRSGETLMGLSRRYKVSVDDIVRWNAQQLGDRRLLWKGETLVIYASGQS